MNLEKRIIVHNKAQVRSTKNGIPWILVYSEEYESRSEAYKREHEIKRMKSRKYIEGLINKRA